MTQTEKKRLPPIVPKKKTSLYNLKSNVISSNYENDTIVIANLKPREDNEDLLNNKNNNNDHNHNNTLEKLVDSISLDTKYEVTNRKKNEPKAITFESIMKPVIRNDIKLHGHNHLKSVETPLEKKLLFEELKNDSKLVKSKPIPPPIKPKPKINLKNDSIKYNNNINYSYNNHNNTNRFTKINNQPNIQVDNTPDFLKDTIQKRLQLSKSNTLNGGIPLPGLADLSQANKINNSTKFNQPFKSHTIDNSILESNSNKTRNLTHPNKNRVKGPKRRLPTEISSSTPPSRSSTSSMSSFSATNTSSTSLPNISFTPIKHKIPPPVPKKPSKPIVINT